MIPGRWVAIGIVAVVAAGWGLASLREPATSAASPSPAPPEAAPVSRPRPAPEPASAFVGVVLPRDAVEVTARTEGQVEQIQIKPGDRVKRGAVLAVLDTAALAAADVKIAEVDLAAALADLKRLQLEQTHATARRARVESLAERQMVSTQDREDAAYQQELAAAKIVAAESVITQKQAVVEQRRTMLENARITAPVDGIVSVRYVERGATVNRGMAVARIVENGSLRLRFAAPAGDAARLRRGAPIAVEVADAGLRLHGTIDAVAPEVDAASQMLIVYGVLHDDAARDATGALALAGRVVRVTLSPDGR